MGFGCINNSHGQKFFSTILMSSYTAESLKQALEDQVRRLGSKIGLLEKLSSRISTIRFIAFIILVGLIYLAARSGIAWVFGVVLALAVILFAGLVIWHRRVDKTEKQLSSFEEIRRHHLARITLDWDNLPASPPIETDSEHPFAHDFNLVGQRSLLQLINTTNYGGSTGYLKRWFLQGNFNANALKKRQRLIQELKPMALFRDRLQLSTKLSAGKSTEQEWTMDDLLSSLRSTEEKQFTLPLVILGSLSVINIVLLILFLTVGIFPYVVISFAIYLGTYNFYSPKVAGLFDEANQIQNLLSQFRESLLYLESFPFKKDSSLQEFCDIYQCEEQKPSKYLKRILRITSAASSQGSELIWLVINGLLPWDMYFSMKLHAYKKDLEPKLSRWLDRFYQLEALNAIANYAWLNPEYIFSLPDENSEDPILNARNLGHPLIPEAQKVTNDVTINEVGDIHLITGSNMAGKSTFLRTIGINLALCFAGAPVDASYFDTIPFRLFSSINVTDSLNEGLSHFYAEVKRLRKLMNELQTDHSRPLFYFVDEIYRGTNNRERLKGSSAFLNEVAGKEGIGLVTTHDLELAQLEETIPSLTNWHFEETIEGDEMYFDYKLKNGPCSSTNALKIMQNEGLPV
jgi:hypothetical protein